MWRGVFRERWISLVGRITSQSRLSSEEDAGAVAVVGMAFRFPGDLGDESTFWSALKEGADLVTEVSSERWATAELQHPKRAEPGRSITFSEGVRNFV